MIVGGQSCESCAAAVALAGPPRNLTHFEFVGALQTYFAGSRVAWSDVVERYTQRLATEGRWRTLARIMSDSGHACSAQLHALVAVHKSLLPRHRRDVLPTHCLICAQARRGGRLDLRI